MPVIYEKCGDDVHELARKVIEKWHPDLWEAGATVGCLFASCDDGPAVKLHGYPCIAKVRIVPYKERVKGSEDIEVIIDQEWWVKHHADERMAIMDHELTHPEPKRDKKSGKIKQDDLGRPKLGMRLHDWEVTGFTEVAMRHKAASAEVQQGLKFINGPDGQMIMGFAGEFDAWDKSHKPGKSVVKNVLEKMAEEVRAADLPGLSVDQGGDLVINTDKGGIESMQKLSDAMGKPAKRQRAAAKS